jgi:hypothetical protein
MGKEKSATATKGESSQNKHPKNTTTAFSTDNPRHLRVVETSPRGLFHRPSGMKRCQMKMARNVARLKSTKAKQKQVHLLCESLTASIKSK